MQIELSEPPEDGKIKLLNAQGKLLLAQDLREKLTTLDTKNIPPGLYLLKITSRKGETTQVVGINL